MCCVFVVYVFESCSSSAALEVALRRNVRGKTGFLQILSAATLISLEVSSLLVNRSLLVIVTPCVLYVVCKINDHNQWMKIKRNL